MRMKTCNVCKADKDLSDFFTDNSRRDGKTSACKPCFKERNARWAAANPEKVLAKRMRENKKKRERDPEYMRAQRKKYNHSDKGRAGRKRYMATEKGKATLRRSEQRNRWPRWIQETYGVTVEDYAWMLYSQDFKCPICLREMSKEVIDAKRQAGKARASVDHCHATGRVRGIVCGWCNHKVLGPLEKSGTQAVLRAMDYLGWVRTLHVEPMTNDLASAERNAGALRKAIEELS